MNSKSKTSSIVWKIVGKIQLDKFLDYFFGDIFTGIFAIIGACAVAEYQNPEPSFSRTRVVHFEEASHAMLKLSSMTYSYQVDGQTVVIQIGLYIQVVVMVMAAVFLLQMIGWTFGWASKNYQMRQYMRPIDELALTAERLAAQGIDEERLQNLEEAIDQITASENNISVGDQDLRGIETAINNLLRRLQASYREQTRFVDDASHELRTPIAVIQGYASMLERWGMDDRETLEEAVHAIREESDHMKELVDQLLFLARGDGGRQQLKMVEIDAAELLKEVAEESKMIDEDHIYEFKQHCDRSIMADEAMIKQAIRIFVDNAAKYTPKGGRITLRLDPSVSGKVMLSVQDEGVGMKAEETAHMFERFFRGDEVRGTTKGSGLGLSIAKWIVERHKGVIKVISYKGIGTRVSIELKGVHHEQNG